MDKIHNLLMLLLVTALFVVAASLHSLAGSVESWTDNDERLDQNCIQDPNCHIVTNE
jgi:hypothetical protein